VLKIVLDVPKCRFTHTALKGAANQFPFAYDCLTLDVTISGKCDGLLSVYFGVLATDALVVGGSCMGLFHNLLRLVSESRSQIVMPFKHLDRAQRTLGIAGTVSGDLRRTSARQFMFFQMRLNLLASRAGRL
jgi:hypothetical protein